MTPAEIEYAAHRRDCLALVGLIRQCLEVHDDWAAEAGSVRWGHVGELATVRQSLLDVAAGFGDGDTAALQAALRSPGDVGAALIDALMGVS